MLGGWGQAHLTHGKTLASHFQTCGKGNCEVWLSKDHSPESSMDPLRLSIGAMLSGVTVSQLSTCRVIQMAQSSGSEQSRALS